jgi:hypothetical protein
MAMAPLLPVQREAPAEAAMGPATARRRKAVVDDGVTFLFPFN